MSNIKIFPEIAIMTIKEETREIDENMYSSYQKQNKDKIFNIIDLQHIKEDLEKFNDWNHFFVLHQTIEENAVKILESSYFSETWLNGTSLLWNLDIIINASYHLANNESGDWITIHKWSDSLVIMILEKEEFKNCRNLPDIDLELSDYILSWKINKFWLPNRTIYWYIKANSIHKNINFDWKIK